MEIIAGIRRYYDKLLFSGFAELTIIVSLRDDSEIKAQYFQHKYFKTIPKGFLNCQCQSRVEMLKSCCHSEPVRTLAWESPG